MSTLVYPWGTDGQNVRFFDVVGGITGISKNHPWLQNLTWTDGDLFTGDPVEPRPISLEICSRMAALKATPRGKELDHWVISPRVVVELYLEGKITQSDLGQIIIGEDYLCLPKTSLGKLVIQPNIPFEYAPSNIIGCLIP
ncbi:hypothetical protein COY91_03970, partial [Candidatus Shapirobacteria bacterium CG_4_10_14_0_8_um_filter_39_15]